VSVEFIQRADGVLVKETFDAETGNPPEVQREGGRRSWTTSSATSNSGDGDSEFKGRVQ
jgi:hypothetical protein